MSNIIISTAAFCLWDIGPEKKMSICKELGFDRIVVAFSTLKMLKLFASSPSLCKQLSGFNHVMIHAPWCGVRYKDNKATSEVFEYLDMILQKVQVDGLIFHFECIKDWSCFKVLTCPFYIKNPNHASWKTFNEAIHEYGFNSVLDINKAVRYENYIDNYLSHHREKTKAIHVSGFVDELGRTPIVESGQVEVLNKIKDLNAPIIIEGLFSPGDFQGIREEIDIIQNHMLG